MSRSRKAVFAIALFLPVVAGGFIVQSAASPQSTVLSQVLQLISQRYVDTLSQSKVFEMAATGLVKELNDPYSELLAPKDLKQFNSRTGGRYAGLGMSIEDHQGSITVMKVYHETPAERGGVREGDRIVKVDTTSTSGWTTAQVSDYLVGVEGTKVSATFTRPGDATPITLNFTRAIVRIPAVPFAITLNSGIGYIPLQVFNENAADEMLTAIKSLSAAGAKGIIVDLRGNPGGILDQSIAVANLFLNQGQLVVSVRGRAGDVKNSLTEKTPALPTTPLIVLTNEFSASASEIVSGALQDHDRALLIGQTTYGKGLVQSIYNLDGGYALKITTAKWFTPSGRSIQRPRKYVNGQFVLETPDTAETEASKKSRPAFKSDAGRTVYGGGGVTPDLIVKEDTLSTPELQFAKLITPKQQDFYLVLYDYAFELRKTAKLDFQVLPAWRDEFFNRLVKKGVLTAADRKTFDAAQRYVDRSLDQRVAVLAFGDSTAKRHDLPFDQPLQRAINLLQSGKTQQELLAAVTSKGSGKQ